MSHHKKILKVFFVVAIVSFSYTFTSVYVLYSQNSNAFPDLWHGAIDSISPDTTSCYYTEYRDSYLPLLESANETIFFHEINCQTTLGLLEACSVESVARAHPNREIIVVFTRALSKHNCQDGTLGVLNKLSNVRFLTVDLNSYAHDTPLEGIFLPRDTSLGKWHYRGIGELLKYLTLYKFGGIVVDFNMMVVRSLDKMGDNWVSMKNGSWETGVVAASRDYQGKYFSKWIMTAMKNQLALTGAANERLALKEVLKGLCNTTNVDEMKRQRCKGFQVYTEEFSNPSNVIYEDPIATNHSAPYVGYLWPENSDYQTAPPIDSFYGHLAKQHCPFVFRSFMVYGPY